MGVPASPPDDFEAVRAVVDALKGFPAEDQRRILRWAQEKLGLPVSPSASAGAATSATAIEAGTPVSTATSRPRDIRAFLQEKRPSSDNQFAAAVAYFFAFEAPEDERKAEITASDLQHAARLSGRERLNRPIETLHNASKRGYLDKGRARGSFRINTVGENLVAMAMPGTDTDESGARRHQRRRVSKKARSRRQR